MCNGCWREHGSPRIDTPATRAVKPLAEEVYRFNAVGGNLHCILDDFNIRDCDIQWAQEQLNRKGLPDPDWLARIEKQVGRRQEHYREDPPDQLAAEQACLDALKPLTVAERAAALAFWEGYWTA